MKNNRPILFENGRVIDPARNLDSGMHKVLVQDNRSYLLAKDEPSPEDAMLYDIEGKWIVPGLVDMHVHLREPGQEYKEPIESGTRAAAAGGFTAVACMPNTVPPNDTASVTRHIIGKAAEAGSCRVYPVAAITIKQAGERLAEFGDLLEAGAVAFSDDGVPVRDPAVMRLALEYSLNFDTLIISHAEEPALSGGGSMNEGRMSTMLGLKGIPNAAEDIAVFRDICLAELVGARLHIAHVSTRGAVEIVRRAKARGVRVTAETAPHYFSLTEDAVSGYNTSAKMNPPLRTEEDRLAVVEGLKDGTLDAIATDHAPHSPLEKDVEFPLAANGITGLETAIPLTLELVRQKALSPLEMVRLLSLAPSSILSLDSGTISETGPADLTVIDPELEWEVSRETLFSRGLNTPFLNKKVKGRAIITVVDGEVRYKYHNICKT
jgi:dihydroorotase